MNRQFPIWRGKGEGVGAFARLRSRIFSRWFLGSELQFRRVVARCWSSLLNVPGPLFCERFEGRYAGRPSARPEATDAAAAQRQFSSATALAPWELTETSALVRDGWPVYTVSAFKPPGRYKVFFTFPGILSRFPLSTR